MNLTPTSMRQCFWAISLWCICIFVIQPRSAEALEWDTATDVAFCSNRPGYEKAGDSVASTLASHGITTEIMYYVRQEGLVLPTDNKARAEGFLVLVNVKNASAAKIILKRAIKDGLRISLLEKSILNPSK